MQKVRLNHAAREKLFQFMRERIERQLDRSEETAWRKALDGEALRCVAAAHPACDMEVLCRYGKAKTYGAFMFILPDGEEEELAFSAPLAVLVPDTGWRFDTPVPADEAFAAALGAWKRAKADAEARLKERLRQARLFADVTLYLEDAMAYLGLSDMRAELTAVCGTAVRQAA